MIRALSLFALTSLVVALPACRKKATPADCDALVDHYAQLATQEALPDASVDEVHAAQTKVRAEAENDDDFRACAGRVTQEELACAMKAQSPDAFEACLQ